MPTDSRPAFDHEAALLACARGDQQALKSIYEHERRWLMGVALRLVRRRELAEEVLHDAFLQIWDKAASFDPALGSAQGWIYTVVRHRALSLLRSSQHVHEFAHDQFDELLESQNVVFAEDRSAERGALFRCLEALDEMGRRLVMDAYVDGYSHSQIAQRTQLPLGTVKTWIRKALGALRQCLS